jgi:tellurite methyltransferase
MVTSDSDADRDEVWSRYFAATADRPVHPIFDSLERFLPSSGVALDLGCGAGRGTLWLLNEGLHVVAVDVSQEAIGYVRERLPEGADVELVCSSFQDFDLGSYDVVVACFTLFFLDRAQFAEFWPRLCSSILPGGLFAGQFLGVNDDWRTRDFTTHNRSEVDNLLQGFEVLLLEEEERDGETAIGERKHWHVFHVIARRI